MQSQQKIYQWAIVGAGPAGLASAGLLIDTGVAPESIIIFDPHFEAGDLGKYWGEVSSNTSVKLFLDFLTQIKSFDYEIHEQDFNLDNLQKDGFCELKEIAKPLSWASEQLCKKISHIKTNVNELSINQSAWCLHTNDGNYYSEKVILATGSEPRTLDFKNIESIPLDIALSPSKLHKSISNTDTVAVFGSSHSSMIIIKNLIDAGVNKVINFYLTPHRYAINMGDWTLYDNTGLKGNTAAWVRDNLSKKSHPKVERYISNETSLSENLPHCQKAVYAIGFNPRHIKVDNITLGNYDKSNGIIAPGLFGTGIAFPREKQDPFGNKELNVGLYKFMNDIRNVLPIWMQYGL